MIDGKYDTPYEWARAMATETHNMGMDLGCKETQSAAEELFEIAEQIQHWQQDVLDGAKSDDTVREAVIESWKNDCDLPGDIEDVWDDLSRAFPYEVNTDQYTAWVDDSRALWGLVEGCADDSDDSDSDTSEGRAKLTEALASRLHAGRDIVACYEEFETLEQVASAIEEAGGTDTVKGLMEKVEQLEQKLADIRRVLGPS